MTYINIQKKSDGSFIHDYNGCPFHATPEYPTAEQYGEGLTHKAIKAYAEAYPEEVVDYVEPIIEHPQLSEEEQTAMDIRRLETEGQSLMPSIQAGIDTERNQQKLVDIMLEIEVLKGNL